MKSYKLNLYQKLTKAAFLLMALGNLGFFAGQVLATEISSLNSDKHIGDPFMSWPKASDSELEQQRGGFLLPNGVNIDISIERIISLNGVETFSSFFQMPGNSFSLQVGDNNIASALNDSALASVIQNNLDDQMISTINTINLEISNLQNINLNHDNRVLTDMPLNIYH